MLKQLALAPGRVMADVQSSALVNSHESATRSSALSKLLSPYSTAGAGENGSFSVGSLVGEGRLEPFFCDTIIEVLFAS